MTGGGFVGQSNPERTPVGVAIQQLNTVSSISFRTLIRQI